MQNDKVPWGNDDIEDTDGTVPQVGSQTYLTGGFERTPGGQTVESPLGTHDVKSRQRLHVFLFNEYEPVKERIELGLGSLVFAPPG